MMTKLYQLNASLQTLLALLRVQSEMVSAEDTTGVKYLLSEIRAAAYAVRENYCGVSIPGLPEESHVKITDGLRELISTQQINDDAFSLLYFVVHAIR